MTPDGAAPGWNETAALPEAQIETHAVSLGNLPHDRQPDARPLGARAPRGRAAEAALAEPWQLLLVDAGSVVDHFGLVYKDIAAARARWKSAGVKYDVGDVNPNQGYVFAPDSGIRVEVFGDPSLPGPVSMDHVHLYAAEADI